jgi:hypothetical protein
MKKALLLPTYRDPPLLNGLLPIFTNSFLNPHMRCYQGADPNIGSLPSTGNVTNLENKKEFKVFVECTAEIEKKELKERLGGSFLPLW